MKNKPIFKDFDLPTMHLEGLEHYVPPKSRDEYEIARRRTIRPGMLLAEYQRRGLDIAATILKHVDRPDDLAFTSNVLAASSMNSSWYGIARNARVMRRRLKLPILGQEDQDYQPNIEGLCKGAANELLNAGLFANIHMAALKYRSPETHTHQLRLGRVVGNAALTIACVGFSQSKLERLSRLPDDLIQQAVRRRGLQALNQGHVMGEEIGTPPSLAQLADPDSDVSIFWRRTAPQGAFDALEIATEIHWDA